MKITTAELMDNAFVITINDTRLDSFMERWDKYGLDRPYVFRGFTMRSGPGIKGDYRELDSHVGSNVANCSFSHLSVIKMAEALDFPFVFVLEDDALPCRNIKDKLDSILDKIPDNTDVLKLGYATRHPPLPMLDNGFSYGYSIGSHAYIAFKKYYRKYEYIFNRHNAVADKKLLNYDAAIHGPEKTALAVRESLFAQKNPCEGYREIHPNNTGWMVDLMQKAPGGDQFDW